MAGLLADILPGLRTQVEGCESVAMTRPEPDTDCRIQVNGTTLALHPSGAVWMADARTLIVADLHFEKGSSYARGGQFLPPYDTRATLRRLQALIKRYQPAQVIALGDSFHDGGAADRLDEEEIAILAGMTRSIDWIWVEGNHDPEPPAWLGGTIAGQRALGGLTFRHIPNPEPCAGEVAGHVHPVVRVHRGGFALRRRCFVSDGLRLLMPAFGAYTGGFDVREEAVVSLFARDFAVFAMGKERVYAVSGPVQLLERKKNVDSQPSATAIRIVMKP
jgi:DNA ligase-associated metallophosphoesterase